MTYRATTIEIKWTTSKAQGTYGYNRVTLYADGTKVAVTCGGGYDMTGTVVADFICARYQDELKQIADRANHGYTVIGKDKTEPRYNRENQGKDTLYGMYSYYNPDGTVHHVGIDGACGLSSVMKIARAIGYDLTDMRIRSKTNDIYIWSPSNA